MCPLKKNRIWKFGLILAILFLTLALTDGESRAAPTFMQIAYWQLDETSGTTFVDAIGDHDGQCTNCPTPLASARINGGQAFDGVDDAIIVNADSAFDWQAGDSFSVELWMKGEVGETCATEDEIFVGRAEDSGESWALGCQGNTGLAVFQLDDGTTSFSLVSDTAVNDGGWRHIAALHDGTTGENILYVDGVSVTGQDTLSGSLSPETAVLSIGHLNGANYFQGALDEVSLYSGLLVEREVLTHYYLTFPYNDACATTVNIMPLGNSITRGYGSGPNPEEANFNHGYRSYLDASLNAIGYNFDFVGTLLDGTQSGFDFDYDHQGYGGYRADQLLGVLPGDLSSTQPHVILLHIGTNDVAQRDDGNYAVDVANVAELLDQIDAYDENTVVILAEIIDQNPNDSSYQSGAVASFNSLLADMAQNRIDAGDKIILIDMYNLLNYTDDVYDWLHPNAAGYDKMEDVWLATLDDFMPTCPPGITSAPNTIGVVDELYNYDVDATGAPAPTFAFGNTPPAGMTIDETTGLIAWTPTLAQQGDHEIVVEATNTFGTDTQTFTVSVSTVGVCLVEPIAYWRLDEVGENNTVPDSIAENDGVCSGNCPQIVTGLIGNAYDFAGSNQIDVADNAIFDWGAEDSFSIQTWINTTQSCTGNKVFLGKFRGGSEDGDWWLGCGDNDAASVTNVAAFWLREGGGGAGGDRINLRGSRSINDGNWHHVLATYDGATNVARLYVDGQLEAEETKDFTFAFANDRPLNIGYFDVLSNEFFYFDGLLDEIGIHDRSLTEVEILQHYTNGSGGVGYCADTAVAPSFISTPKTSVSAGDAYRYMAHATGIPAPTYSLLTGPSGMNINADTGLIQWEALPESNGNVEIEASNLGGTDNQTFTIQVETYRAYYLPVMIKADQ